MTKKDAEENLAVIKKMDKTLQEMRVVLEESKETRNAIKAELHNITVCLAKIDKLL